VRRRLAVLVLAAVLSGGLAGCAPAPELSDSAATGLQASVQLVAAKAAAGDPAAAVAELDALQSKLDAAVAGGDVVDERSVEIQAKIDAVRADLQQQIADAEAAAAAAAAAQAAADAAAEAQRVAAEQAEAQRLADEAAARENAKPDKGPKKDTGPGKP
jgi:hypothetical protein